ncbi:MAG: DEAD/DEAH box helicase family protein [Termitinemataceae bacterium]|nr:MAG: DEAD/DEAH box helicase family protein [Termitinemataceae bacterium]
MTNIYMAEFQLKAVGFLLEAMESNKKEIVLKSCTGSGKTVILTYFINEYFRGHHNTVFVWLTPGKGNLEEQSKKKMDEYINNSNTKLLYDVMTSGFSADDACFINWEKLTKKGNNALKESERTNFLEHIDHAHNSGLRFKIIVDESHQNDTIKADDIIDYFKTDKIIRTSATPKGYTDAILIDIPESDVVVEGLIKKLLIINENFPQKIDTPNQSEFLLDRALAKQQDLYNEFLKRNAEINPLIIVQMPNNDDVLLDEIERYFESKNITYENKKLAVWLAGKKENLEEIENSTAEPIAIIIKQAVSTGWDCPRAHILVKLRDNMGDVFEIQTIGRIRRMPEAQHYESDLLDSCYLYTLDEKFTECVRQSLEHGALDAVKLYLKPECKKIELVSEQKPTITATRDKTMTLAAINAYMHAQYNLSNDTARNKKQLETAGFNFSSKIIETTKSGEISTLNNAATQIDSLNDVVFTSELNTHKHGRLFHHRVGEICLKIGLDYDAMNTILRLLFVKDVDYDHKLLELSARELYSFTLNNSDRIKDAVLKSMAMELSDPKQKGENIITVKFNIPQETIFTYDSKAKSQELSHKNVYKGYLSSGEPRSTSEKLFEKFCETAQTIDWFYKNGDKGPEYFSIIYQDNFGKLKSFYPDYIVSIKKKIWVIETKGGFDRTGKSEDIDIFSSKKFIVLKDYLRRHKFSGGFVRQDKKSMELCICTDNYNDDINSTDWKLLKDVFE